LLKRAFKSLTTNSFEPKYKIKHLKSARFASANRLRKSADKKTLFVDFKKALSLRAAALVFRRRGNPCSGGEIPKSGYDVATLDGDRNDKDE